MSADASPARSHDASGTQSPALAPDAAAYLTQPGLKRALEGARAQVERLGRVGGTVRLSECSAAEASALAGLLGILQRRERPRIGRPLLLPVRDLDLALRATRFGCSLPAALELTGPALELRPQRRARERERTARMWAAAAEHPLCVREPLGAEWVRSLRERGTLSRVAGSGGPRLLREALDIGVRLPSAPAVERTRLAAEVAGDAHALDDDRALARLLLSQLSSRAGEARPRMALERRALWGRFGVLSDATSSDVLTLGLPPLPGGPLAAALGLLAGQHVRLTVGQLARERLRFPRGLDVFVCENPTVVAAAQQRHPVGCRPLICTEGWPSSACWTLLELLTRDGAALRFHADFDWDGVRIAALLAERFGAVPWRFDRTGYEAGIARDSGRARPLTGRVAREEIDPELISAMREHRRALHEEAVLDQLLDDLGGP